MLISSDSDKLYPLSRRDFDAAFFSFFNLEILDVCTTKKMQRNEMARKATFQTKCELNDACGSGPMPTSATQESKLGPGDV